MYITIIIKSRIKYLSITLSNDLTFNNEHITFICNKAKRMFGFVKRKFNNST